jgi:hypothetical protein
MVIDEQKEDVVYMNPIIATLPPGDCVLCLCVICDVGFIRPLFWLCQTRLNPYDSDVNNPDKPKCNVPLENIESVNFHKYHVGGMEIYETTIVMKSEMMIRFYFMGEKGVSQTQSKTDTYSAKAGIPTESSPSYKVGKSYPITTHTKAAIEYRLPSEKLTRDIYHSVRNALLEFKTFPTHASCRIYHTPTQKFADLPITDSSTPSKLDDENERHEK